MKKDITQLINIVKRKRTKSAIISGLGTWSLDNLGDAIFVKKIGHKTTFCLDFESTDSDAELVEIRMTTSDDGSRVNKSEYTPNCGRSA